VTIDVADLTSRLPEAVVFVRQLLRLDTDDERPAAMGALVGAVVLLCGGCPEPRRALAMAASGIVSAIEMTDRAAGVTAGPQPGGAS
jgi:hypothetical protein